MLVTPLESVIFFSLVQPENALSPILVALPRMVILTLHNSNYGVDLKDGQVCFYFTLYSELKLAKLQ